MLRKALLWCTAITLTVLLLYATLMAVVIARASPKALWHQVTLEFANPHPDYTYFLVCGTLQDRSLLVERLALTDGHAVCKKEEGLGYTSTYRPLRLCAVPNELTVHFRPGVDWIIEPDWFEKPLSRDDQAKLRWSGELGPQFTHSSLTDPRQSISRRYRVEHTPTELKVDLIEEKVVESWATITVLGGAGLSAFLVVAWFIVWLVWKARRP